APDRPAPRPHPRPVFRPCVAPPATSHASGAPNVAAGPAVSPEVNALSTVPGTDLATGLASARPGGLRAALAAGLHVRRQLLDQEVAPDVGRELAGLVGQSTGGLHREVHARVPLVRAAVLERAAELDGRAVERQRAHEREALAALGPGDLRVAHAVPLRVED